MNPFTIRIFVPSGDPEELRIVDRLSSTAMFFSFPRSQWKDVRKRSELQGAGIYVLTGYENPDDELSTVYVGQADTISVRIDQHAKSKDFWDKAVVFVSDNKINSTHAKWLEYSMIRKLNLMGRSKIDNGNAPGEPTISEAEKAEMQVFLKEIYQTLPLLDVRAFEKVKTVIPGTDSSKEKETVANVGTETRKKDTIIVPAREDGFRDVFIGENSWYAIRIAGGRIDDIKYIAAYQVAPVSAITHYAEVDKIESYGESGKYKVFSKLRSNSCRSPLFSIVPPAISRVPVTRTCRTCFRQRRYRKCSNRLANVWRTFFQRINGAKSWRTYVRNP